MSERPPVIWRFTDGKAGHENQSLALVENLQMMASFEAREVSASRREKSVEDELKNSPPDLVLGAGHRTHLAILRASRRHACPSVVIMNPTVPRAFFDLCLVPEHDLSPPLADNVIVTRGMLNRIPKEIPPKENCGLILIGGPSKHHGWDASGLLAGIAQIVDTRPELSWRLTDSRRTPEGFLERLASPNLSVHASAATPPDWLPRQLLAAREVWVSEDSMSMIYEALTAQARVGLLPMPRLEHRSRITRGIDHLVETGWTRFFAPGLHQDLPVPPEVIHEASRCAREVMRRFFPALV